MTDQDPNSIRFPLEGLLDRLALAGCPVSPRQRLLLWRTLQQFGTDYLERPHDLKFRLAPLIATNAAEQENFYQIFDKYLADLRSGVTEPIEPPSPPPLQWWERVPRGLWVILLVLGLLVGGYLITESTQQRLEDIPKAVRFDGPRDLRIGDTAEFYNRSLGFDSTEVQYFWLLLDGATGAVEDTLTGPDTLVLSFTDDNGQPEKLLELLALTKTDTLTSGQRRLNLGCADLPQYSKITAPTRVGLEEQVTFSLPEPFSPDLTYTWNFGDGNQNTGYAVTHAFAKKGAYTIILKVDRPGVPGRCTQVIEHQFSVGDQVAAYLPYLTLVSDEMPSVLYAGWAIWLLLLLLVLVASICWYRWLQQPPPSAPQPDPEALKTRFTAADRGPYEIPFAPHDEYLVPDSCLFNLATALRRRQEGLRSELDVPTTIQQTIEGGGFPSIALKRTTLPPNYLFLIDEQAAHSHQAQLYRYLMSFLQAQDVHLAVYWYKKKPLRFWNAQYPNGLSLDQVHRLYPQYRLLVLGNGHAMLDPYAQDTARLQDRYAAVFRRWSNRILLTPLAARDWTFAEATIYSLFSIFPSDEEGLQAAMAFLETDQQEEDERARAPYLVWEQAFVAKDQFPSTLGQLWRKPDTYRRYFVGRDALYRWFCALTVHPTPTWPVTLAIGRVIGAPVTFDNLLILSRIPWLQGQPLSPRVMDALRADLDPQTERQARAALAEALEEAAPAAQNSHANRKLQTELAIQEFLLSPEDKNHRDTIQYLLQVNGLPPRQQRELTQSLNHLTGQPVGNVQDFLAKAEEGDQPRQRLRLTPPFFWAWLFSTLAGLLGLGIATLSGTERLYELVLGESDIQPEQTLDYFTGLPAAFQELLDRDRAYQPSGLSKPLGSPFPNWLFREAVVTDSAVLANNAAAEGWLTDLQEGRGHQTQARIAAEDQLRLASALRQNDYPVAAINRSAMAYHEGHQFYSRYLETFEEEIALREAEQIFKSLVNKPQVGDVARHGLGLVLYYQGALEAARVQYEALQRSGFFKDYPLTPNLQTLLSPEEEGLTRSDCLPLPRVTWPEESMICAGGMTVSINADPPDGVNYSAILVAWGDGRIDTLEAGSPITHTYGTIPVLDELTLDVSVFGSCVDEGAVYNTLSRTYPLGQTANADFLPRGGIEICAGESVAFTAQNPNADTYRWTFGIRQSSDIANPEITFDQPGNYTVRLITANACGEDTVTVVDCITVLSEFDCPESNQNAVQTYQVAGQVVDGFDARALDGVGVMGPGGQTTTDAQGNFTLELLAGDPGSETTVTFSLADYQRLERSFRTSRPGGVQSVGRIVLMPARPSGEGLEIIDQNGRVGLRRDQEWVWPPIFNNIEYDPASQTYRLQIDDRSLLSSLGESDGDPSPLPPPRSAPPLYFGLADAEGSIIIPLEYRALRFPREGLVAAETNLGWGYLNAETGEIVLSHSLENAQSFQNGRATVQDRGTTFIIDRQGICQSGCPDAYLRNMLEGYLQSNYADMDQAREALLNHPQLSRMLEAALTNDFLGDPNIGREDVTPEDRRVLNRLRELFERATDLSAEVQSRYRSLFDRIERIQDAAASPPTSDLQTPNSELQTPAFVPIPGGTFTMGCESEERDGDCGDDEKPSHEVTVSGFAMSIYEITNEQYAAFLNAEGNQEEGGRTWYQPDLGRIEQQGTRFVVTAGYEDHPVVAVSWYGARAYARWLSAQTGDTYRLPTEAEWEYAARGGEKGAQENFRYAGSNDIDAVAWYDGNSDGRTHPVGQKQPNQLGLYDMSGNVWEWVADWFGEYPANAQTDPTGPAAGIYRILRGGSWNDVPRFSRTAYRDSASSIYSNLSVGFRLARSSR